MKDIVNEINKRYVKISNRVTKAYEGKLALPCDLYFPVYPPYNETTAYKDMKIFSPHQSPTYSKEPDVKNAYFYIPHLIKKDNFNSSEYEFDSYFTEDEPDRPFIETSKKRELPLMTKVVVYQGKSISKFFVDKKLVVTGADGFMLLRMYLSPLSKDDDGEIEEQEETTVEGTDYSPSNVIELGEELSLGSVIQGVSTAQVTGQVSEQVTGKVTGQVQQEPVTPKVADVNSNLRMNIPDEDE